MDRTSTIPPDDLPDIEQEQADQEARERLERQLVSYAFVREEAEGEVRLLFRDVPANDLARAFRAAGANLISLAGERMLPPQAPQDQQMGIEVSNAQETQPRGRRRRKQNPAPPPAGDVVLHYFYALGGLVYTVSIAASAEVFDSVAGIYPVAALSEGELHRRLAIYMRSPV